jgi:hypothetical protein
MPEWLSYGPWDTEGFRSQESFIGQTAGNLANHTGAAALLALPAFKVALWHKDQFVRAWAGRLILKLAPQELPINEGTPGRQSP